MSDAVRDVIVGATTALSMFGAFLLFGVCLVVSFARFVEEWKKSKKESSNGQGDS